MEEFVTTAIALKKDNPQPGNFSGFWLPGQDWRNGVTFLWDAGGDLAVQDGDEWKGSLSSPESIAGLTTVQKLFEEASGAAKDGNEANPEVPFCNNEIAMFSAPGWQRGVLESPDTGCPDLAKKVGVFALPGSDGSPAPVLLGGSNIAVAAKSQNQDLAEKAVALMLSDDYQKILAQNGLTRRRPHWQARSARTSSPRRRLPPPRTPSSRRRRLAGQASKGPGSSRTCSSPSPTAVTWNSSPRRPTRRSPNSSTRGAKKGFE